MAKGDCMETGKRCSILLYVSNLMFNCLFIIRHQGLQDSVWIWYLWRSVRQRWKYLWRGPLGLYGNTQKELERPYRGLLQLQWMHIWRQLLWWCSWWFCHFHKQRYWRSKICWVHCWRVWWEINGILVSRSFCTYNTCVGMMEKRTIFTQITELKQGKHS